VFFSRTECRLVSGPPLGFPLPGPRKFRGFSAFFAVQPQCLGSSLARRLFKLGNDGGGCNDAEWQAGDAAEQITILGDEGGQTQVFDMRGDDSIASLESEPSILSNQLDWRPTPIQYDPGRIALGQLEERPQLFVVQVALKLLKDLPRDYDGEIAYAV
jgi:hypothetical protein